MPLVLYRPMQCPAGATAAWLRHLFKIQHSMMLHMPLSTPARQLVFARTSQSQQTSDKPYALLPKLLHIRAVMHASD